MHATTYKFATVNGRQVFYREAGNPSQPTIILLHGFPSSSHMYRDLIPLLADTFHVIAPDYIGFGQSDAPAAADFDYRFDNLTAHVAGSDRSARPEIVHPLHAGLWRPGRLPPVHPAS